MPRGGKRVGTPGKSYGNRSDLHQPVQVRTDLPYGQKTALEAQLRAQPLAQTTGVPGPAQTPLAAPGPAPAAPPPPTASMPAMPGDSPFDRESERPDEHVMAGTGGPMMAPTPNDPVLAQLTALYQTFRDPDLLKIIELRANNAQPG